MLVLTVILGILAAAFAALWLLSRKNLKNAVEELRRLGGVCAFPPRTGLWNGSSPK